MFQIRIYIIALLIGLSSSLSAVAETAWYEKGERLHYKISFWGLKAGESELLYSPEETGDYRIVGRAWTTFSLFRLLDRFTVHGKHLENHNFMNDSYALRLNEGGYRANKLVTYSREAQEAVYENIHAKQKPVSYPIDENARDMISALYHLRESVGNLEVGDVFKLPVFDLNTQYTMSVYVREKGTMKTAFGAVPVVHIQPVLDHMKDQNKKDRWHIWITDDARRLPVQIKVKLRFGSFKADLKSVGGKDAPSKVPSHLPETGDFHVKETTENEDYVNPIED